MARFPWRALVAAILLAVVGSLWMGDHAWSHAALIESSPAAGDHLAESPARLRLRFNETVEPVDLRLISRAGANLLGAEAVRIEDGLVTITLAGALAPGPYAVSYRVISQDSHVVSGAIDFSVGPAAPETAAGLTANPDPAERVWSILFWLVRTIFVLALLALAFRPLAVGFDGIDAPSADARRPGGSRRLPDLGLAALIIGLGLASLGLKGAMSLGASAADWLTARPWALGASTSLGPSVLVASLGALAVGFSGGSAPRIAVARLGVLLCLVSFPLTGHAGRASPVWLMTPTLLIHVGLAGLALSARGGRSQRLKTFAGLVVTGGILTIVQLGTVEALWRDPYGWILVAKIAAASGLALIVATRLVVPSWRRPMALGLSVAVIALTTALGQVEPPRAGGRTLARATTERDLVLSDQGFKARVAISPGRAGPNRISVRVFDAAGAVLTPKGGDLSLTLPAAGAAPLTKPLTRAADGVIDDLIVIVPMDGDWTIDLRVRVTDFDLARFEGTLAIAP